MDDGVEQLIAHAKVKLYEAETQYALRRNKTKYMENLKEKETKEKEWRRDYDEDKIEAIVQERIPKEWVAFNSRAAAAVSLMMYML